MRVNCKDRIVSIVCVQYEPCKYPVMLQNKQSYELINNAKTV